MKLMTSSPTNIKTWITITCQLFFVKDITEALNEETIWKLATIHLMELMRKS